MPRFDSPVNSFPCWKLRPDLKGIATFDIMDKIKKRKPICWKLRPDLKGIATGIFEKFEAITFFHFSLEA